MRRVSNSKNTGRSCSRQYSSEPASVLDSMTQAVSSSSSSSKPVVAIFGGSGFLGSNLVKRLAPFASEVRVATRYPDAYNAKISKLLAKEENSFYNVVKAEHVDVLDVSSVTHTIEGADVVVNATGLTYESINTYEQVHITGSKNVSHAAHVADVPTFIHFSAMGTNIPQYSRWAVSKMRGEDIAFAANPKLTILRPNLMFGPGDAFTRRSMSPVVFVPCASSTVQPVYVNDVTQAVLHIIKSGGAHQGLEYDLSGSEKVTYGEFYSAVLKAARKARITLPLPASAAWLAAAVLQWLPKPSLTTEMIPVLNNDIVMSEDALSLTDLGVAPTKLHEALDDYLSRRK